MNKVCTLLGTIPLAALLAGCDWSSPNVKLESTLNPVQKLKEASTITIEERVLNLGKDYNIIVGGEKVATVSGKDINVIGGDVFTLTTVDGQVLASEKEHARFLSLSRTASCYDKQGTLTGYIGEETLKDFFSLSYVFHFYDANKQELGTSRKLGKSSFNRHKLYDTQGNADYDIDKHFSLVGDTYTLTVLDKESAIPLTSAIFMVCIEDAIGDSHK